MGEIADDMVDGFSCSGCGIYFLESHGYPVLCKSCYKGQGGKRSRGLQQATIKEMSDATEAERKERQACSPNEENRAYGDGI